MYEVQADIAKWLDGGDDVALAQIMQAFGSSPRKPGSVMAYAEAGGLSGSVSGGCVEGAVIDSMLDCLASGARRTETFHASFTDEAEFEEVGLACGGGMEILVSKLQPRLFACEREELRLGNEYVRVSGIDVEADFLLTRRAGMVEGLSCLELGKWFLCMPESVQEQEKWYIEVAKAVVEQLEKSSCMSDQKKLQSAGTGKVACGEHLFFYHKVMPKPKLICIGGVHISVHLTQMAKMLGYHTVVIDPRSVFSTEERFHFVDELWREWPQKAFGHLTLDGATAVCVLTHDPKIDVPALAAAIHSPAFYIGCLGRTTTQLDRWQALREEGFTDEEIRRVHGPIGLELGGREPAEIALAIMAEITMAKAGGSLPTRRMPESAQAGAAERQAGQSGC